MKKKELEALEGLNKQRKLNKDVKHKICKKLLNNFLLATVILLYFIILKYIALNLEKQVAILIYKVSSVVSLTFTIVLFEISYKKDSDNLALLGIEMLFVSVITLLTPYILIQKSSVGTSVIGVYFVIYYIIKNLIIYRNQKNEYLKEISDITEIVKKESKDKLAQEQLEKNREVKKEVQEPKKRGRGRPKKIISETTKNIKTTTKKTEKVKETETPKRKRGRPKKIVNS